MVPAVQAFSGFSIAAFSQGLVDIRMSKKRNLLQSAAILAADSPVFSRVRFRV